MVVLFASIGDEPQVLCITGKSTVSHVSKLQQLIVFVYILRCDLIMLPRLVLNSEILPPSPGGRQLSTQLNNFIFLNLLICLSVCGPMGMTRVEVEE